MALCTTHTWLCDVVECHVLPFLRQNTSEHNPWIEKVWVEEADVMAEAATAEVKGGRKRRS